MTATDNMNLVSIQVKALHSSYITLMLINSFPAGDNFCCLLTAFVNSLDPDQAQQNVG